MTITDVPMFDGLAPADGAPPAELAPDAAPIAPKPRRVRPPRDRAPRPPAADKRGPGRPSVAAKREQQITAMVGGVGMMMYAVNPADGTAILNGTPGLAAALAKVAEQNSRIAKVIDAVNEGGAWLEVTVAAAAIVLPILANHGALPAGAAALFAPPLEGDATDTPAAA